MGYTVIYVNAVAIVLFAMFMQHSVGQSNQNDNVSTPTVILSLSWNVFKYAFVCVSVERLIYLRIKGLCERNVSMLFWQYQYLHVQDISAQTLRTNEGIDFWWDLLEAISNR